MITRYPLDVCAVVVTLYLPASGIAQNPTPDVEPTFVISNDAPTPTRTWAMSRG
jgi:hypothetical protein